MLKEVLLTHTDLDGAGCRIIYELRMLYSGLDKNKDWKVYHCNNNGPKGINAISEDLIVSKEIGGETIVTIADICPSKEVIEHLRDHCKEVYIFDHHFTAEFAKNIEGINATIVSEASEGLSIRKESGTSLLWLEYVDRATKDKNNFMYQMFDTSSVSKYKWDFIAYLVNEIRLYDTYEWKKENDLIARRLQLLWQLLRMDKFCNHYIKRIMMLESDEKLIYPEYDIFIDAKLDFTNETISNFSKNDCYIIDVKGYKTALVVKATMANVSELAYQFLTKNPDIDIFALFSLYDGGTFAFRTQKDYINMGEFAESLGGGGHPKSAGASVPKEILFNFYDQLFYWLNGLIEKVEEC